MSTKRRKLFAQYASPVTLRFGMLLACFAWIMHVSMLLTPLWDKDAHLGHGICIKLAPIVSMAEQYEQIQADIEHAEHNLPTDSAAFHLHHHHTGAHTSASTSTADPTADAHTPLSSKQLHSNHHTKSADSDAIKHPSCDICLSMTAVLVPQVFAAAHPDLLVLPAVATSLYHSNTHFLIGFLRPFTRAPPQSLFK